MVVSESVEGSDEQDICFENLIKLSDISEFTGKTFQAAQLTHDRF